MEMSSTPERPAPRNFEPVTVFCGKGGVGKTSLSLAFALRQAGKGLRVLVITSHPLPELALSVSLAGLKEADPVAASGLFVVHIDPHEILSNVVRQNLGASRLTDTLLSSRIYQSLVEVVPGLKELAVVSRVRDLAVQGVGPEAPAGFDRVVWDAPATGHFLRTLEVARDFDTHLSGPLALLGKSLAGFLSRASSMRLIPVAILEEMAVDETIELCEKLTRGLGMPPAALVCNMASPLLGTSEEEWEKLRRDLPGEVGNPAGAAFLLERHEIERRLFTRLRHACGATARIVPRKGGWKSDVELLLDLAGKMDGLL
jgi:Anion-transporting ATPase